MNRDSVAQIQREIVEISCQVGCDALGKRAQTEVAAILEKPEIVVALVGEFKAGKSSLLNQLLGRAVAAMQC